MARPRIFDTIRCSLNVYLHKDQLEWLRKQGRSPSATIRELIERERDLQASISLESKSA